MPPHHIEGSSANTTYPVCSPFMGQPIAAAATVTANRSGKGEMT